MNQFLKILFFFFITSIAFAQTSEQQKLEEKLGEALNEWPMTPEHTINAMNILREAAAKKIKWT